MCKMSYINIGDRGTITIDSSICKHCGSNLTVRTTFDSVYQGHVQVHGVVKHQFKLLSPVLICKFCRVTMNRVQDDCEDYILVLEKEFSERINV